MSDLSTAAPASAALRVAVCDGDTGFVQVLTNRLDRLGWEHRVLGSAVPVERLVSMRLGALVLDLALLGQHAWEYLERVTRELPSLPVVVCTGQSTVAQRVRGLRLGADDWLTKPCHPEELIARVEAVARRREGVDGQRNRQAGPERQVEAARLGKVAARVAEHPSPGRAGRRYAVAEEGE